jgi:glutathione S-transferase
MDPVIIYADYMSQPSRAVLTYCEIAKIPYKLHEIRVISGDTFTEEFSKISPSQSVPTMVHGSLTLYESNAILTYLISSFPISDNWYPNDNKKKALVNNYLHWHHMNIRFGCGIYLFNKTIGPKLFGIVMKDIENLSNEKREEAFQILEIILERHQFVAGTDEVSIADIVCYCEVVQMMLVKVDLKKYPKLENWLDRIGRIPEVQKTHRVFFKLLPRFKL